METLDNALTEGAADAVFTPQGRDLGSLSVGSDLHSDGKCKPCVFYHEPQGCSNGTSCAFCHACPPHEFERRKRLRQSLLKPKGKVGHRRQGSDASTTASIASDRKLSHSRQSSMNTASDGRKTSPWPCPEGDTADQGRPDRFVDSLEEPEATRDAEAPTTSKERRRARRQQGRVVTEEFKDALTPPGSTYMMVPMMAMPMDSHDYVQDASLWNSTHWDMNYQSPEQNQIPVMCHGQPWYPMSGPYWHTTQS